MADLAIKGHETRGEEVIKLLEMLGGTNDYFKHNGKIENFYYYIGNNNHIYQCGLPSEMKCFTLEEFEEKFPYKVGDNVACYVGLILEKEIHTITEMYWDSNKCRIQYHIDNGNVLDVRDILYSVEYKTEQSNPIETKSFPPYMDYDIKENKEKKINQMSLANCDLDEVEIVLGDKFELKIREGKYYAIRKKILYPKTYEECCQVLMGKTDFQDFELVLTKYVINRSEENSISLVPPHISLINNFYKILICRDAYWKIAGEQMGLDKPWKPDWGDYGHNAKFKYTITTIGNNVIRETSNLRNYTLAFPSEEMRDAFYECFKVLIEDCKELL